METKFNFNSQVCTSRSQSERLLALGLKEETADCNLSNYSLKGKGYQDDWQVGTTPYSDCLESWSAFAKDSCWELIPAWSLHRLIELCSQQICIGKRKYFHTLHLINNEYVAYIDDIGDAYKYHDERDLYNSLISCIEWLIKEGYFNKEYLNGNG